MDRQAVLQDYFARLRRMGVRAEAHALLTESSSLRNVFAYGATYGRGDFEFIKSEIGSGASEAAFDPEWLAKLARVCALQDIEEDDSLFALNCLRLANRKLPKTSANIRFHRLEVELLSDFACYEEGLKRVAENSKLSELFHGYLGVDLNNPFLRDSASFDSWLYGFNEPFRYCGVRPLLVDRSSKTAFDGLHGASVEGPSPQGPKVSVVMTSYKPDHDAFMVSAKSILQQSWTNIELVIVDDATPGNFTSVLDEIEAMDSRVRVVRLEQNGGTYRARNAGMAVSSGDLITGQDADDWSHPDRLLTQVRYLQNNPDRPGVVTSAIRTDETLLRIRRGQNPGRRCEVSLMIRSEIARSVGGYLPARKAADSEFRQRISFYAGTEVGEIGDPLYMIRLLPNSLSRGDFRPGWSHPTRRAFWNACNYWHKNSSPDDLYVDGSTPAADVPLPIPARFQVQDSREREFDVIFVADFREFSGRQRSVIDEIKLLLERDVRVGVLQLESLRYPATGALPLCEAIQELINSRVVGHVVPSEAATATTVVLRDPALLQFPPSNRSNLKAKNLLVVAEDAPASMDGEHAQYLPAEVSSQAAGYFGSDPLWVASGPLMRDSLVQHGLSLRALKREDWPLVINADDWMVPRSRWRNKTPVVGRHAENMEMLWPGTAKEIDVIWPDDSFSDIRVLGDARAALRISNRRTYPVSWTVFRGKEIAPRAFYSSLDFFVYYSNSRWPEDRSREVLEAMAAGCVVVAPETLKAVYGDSAIYADPHDVASLIVRFRDRWKEYLNHSRRARGYAVDLSRNPLNFEKLDALLDLGYESREEEVDSATGTVS